MDLRCCNAQAVNAVALYVGSQMSYNYMNGHTVFPLLHIYVGLDVSRKRKTKIRLAINTQQHEQTRAVSQPQGKLPLQITHAQGDTRGASAPREERKEREMEGNSTE